MKRDLRLFLYMQAAAAALAVVSFRVIEVRWQAAILAGSGFVLVGIWMVLKTLRWPNRFQYAMFYLSRVHLWLFALPMVLVRLRYLGHDFNEVHFLGIPGPEFHRWSEWAYLAMVAGTFLDLLRVRLGWTESKS